MQFIFETLFHNIFRKFGLLGNPTFSNFSGEGTHLRLYAIHICYSQNSRVRKSLWIDLRVRFVCCGFVQKR